MEQGADMRRAEAISFLRLKRMTDRSSDMLIQFAAKARLPEKLVLDTGRQTAERFDRMAEGTKTLDLVTPYG